MCSQIMNSANFLFRYIGSFSDTKQTYLQISIVYVKFAFAALVK